MTIIIFLLLIQGGSKLNAYFYGTKFFGGPFFLSGDPFDF